MKIQTLPWFRTRQVWWLVLHSDQSYLYDHWPPCEEQNTQSCLRSLYRDDKQFTISNVFNWKKLNIDRKRVRVWHTVSLISDGSRNYWFIALAFTCFHSFNSIVYQDVVLTMASSIKITDKTYSKTQQLQKNQVQGQNKYQCSHL